MQQGSYGDVILTWPDRDASIHDFKADEAALCVSALPTHTHIYIYIRHHSSIDAARRAQLLQGTCYDDYIVLPYCHSDQCRACSVERAFTPR